MGKYVVRLSDDNEGVVIDADTLERWLEAVHAGVTPPKGTAEYVANRIRMLIVEVPF